MTVELVFEEPPGQVRRGPSELQESYEPIFRELQKHPKKWAMLGEFPGGGIAGRKRTSLIRAPWLPGEYEITVRTNGDGARLYARYIGPRK